MIVAIGIIAYIIVGLLTADRSLAWMARRFPDLPLDGAVVAMAGLLGLWWPIGLPLSAAMTGPVSGWFSRLDRHYRKGGDRG